MTDSERKIFDCIAISQLDVAFERLRKNTDYQEKCRIHKQIGEAAQQILRGLEKEASNTLLDYCNSEGDTTSMEYDEIYMQGLQDSIRILTLLGVL